MTKFEVLEVFSQTSGFLAPDEVSFRHGPPISHMTAKISDDLSRIETPTTGLLAGSTRVALPVR